MRTRASYLLIGIFLFLVLSASADIPRLITYQGRLTDDTGAPAHDGAYDITFIIYDDSTSGTNRWEETASVGVLEGLFNVQLGTKEQLTADLFADYPDLFLAMNLNGEPEMQPRTRLTAGAFSFHALSLADNAVTGATITDGSIGFTDIGQNGAAEGEAMVWKSGEWTTANLPNGDITSVTAGDGLGGGGTSSGVTLHVGAGAGINVAADEVALDEAYADERYVNVEGDIMTDNLFLDNPPGETIISIQKMIFNQAGLLTTRSYEPHFEGQKTAVGGAYGGIVEVRDSDGTITGELLGFEDVGGALRLKQEDGTFGISLYGGSTTDGARLYMYSAGGALRAKIDADDAGNGATWLPAGSVSADEIFDEPGIVANLNATTIDLNGTMKDLATVSITTPGAGYIVLEGNCIGMTSGTLGANFGLVQIDETVGGMNVVPYYTIFGHSDHVTGAYNYVPVYVTRTYYKSVGTYEFRLEGKISTSNAPGALTQTKSHFLRATFHPTSYGTVASLVPAEEAEEFESAEPRSGVGADPVGGESTPPMYRVDLRELELKAARERAEAERAERELLEARLVREQEQEKQRGLLIEKSNH